MAACHTTWNRQDTVSLFVRFRRKYWSRGCHWADASV